MTWQPELDELRAREALAKQMGGADKVERQRGGGHLTVRERINPRDTRKRLCEFVRLTERLLTPGRVSFTMRP